MLNVEGVFNEKFKKLQEFLQLLCQDQGLRHCNIYWAFQFSSVAQSCLTLCYHELQHVRPPCPSPTTGAYSNSCRWSQWCHPTISSSVIPFSSCLQSFPVSGSFTMSQFSPSSGQSVGFSASASVLPMNIQDWFSLGWTGWISLQSTGLSRVFSNTTIQKHQFFSAQFSLKFNSHIHTWLLEKKCYWALTKVIMWSLVSSLCC